MKVFHILGLQIGFLGLMAAIGLLVGLYIANKEIKRKGLSVDVLYSLAIYTVISALIGARLFYVIFYKFSYYQQYPMDIFKITDGGMSIHGGLLAAFLVAFVYIKIHHLNFLKYADAIAPSIILGQGIGRVGCDVFGKPMETERFFGVIFQGHLVHPVQMYEALLNYFVFFFLWRIRKHTTYHGQLFFLYIILFAINRGFVEFFRINPSVIGWFTISHLLSVVFIIIAVVGIYKTRRNKANEKAYIVDINSSKEKQLTLIKDIGFIVVIIVLSFLIFYGVQS